MMTGGASRAPTGASGVLRGPGSAPADACYVFGYGDFAVFRSPACASNPTATLEPTLPAGGAAKQPYCAACGCFRAKVLKASGAALKPPSIFESHTALHRRDPGLLVERAAALVKENTALKAAVELKNRKIARLVDEVRG